LAHVKEFNNWLNPRVSKDILRMLMIMGLILALSDKKSSLRYHFSTLITCAFTLVLRLIATWERQRQTIPKTCHC